MIEISERKELLANKKVKISCIAPAHNEEEQIANFISALSSKLKEVSDVFEILIIDDGSTDKTLEKIYSNINNNVKVIVLARNFGKENALAAGLEHASGDVAILIDADFQHPIDLIPVFLEQWSNGFDMVYGVQSSRGNEKFGKKILTNFFYKLMGKISRVDIPANAGDFRLLDRIVVDALNSLDERNRFMKGLYAWVGFKSKAVPFTAPKRVGGNSKWSFVRLVDLAVTGITSFSNLPLRFWSMLGLIISLCAFLTGLYIILITLIFGVDVPGYPTLLVAIVFFGGIQLLSVGILGEYIARIFTEVKRRPKYIVAQKIGF
jgi:glycosyltransferase involved in cell wall biosynthesis